MNLHSNPSDKDPSSTKPRIRGVNLGGWLMLERYIAPSLFAVTECHLQGNFCWYEGSLSAPRYHHPVCSDECRQRPVLVRNVFNSSDYPLDEWNLAQVFSKRPKIGEEWLNHHFENFISFSDLEKVKNAGITHVRVPLPHWILGNIAPGEPWITGDRWKYFVRLCGWCRKLGLQVWPNIHTAPGSQNGFDNSGRQFWMKTCGGWKDDPTSIPRSLQVIQQVTAQIQKDRLLDVVTGFGLLNEPYVDCNLTAYEAFLEDGLEIARSNLGKDAHIFVSDLFSAPRFNDGNWWLDPEKYHNTYLDSHYYNVFGPAEREMTPAEHIADVCNPQILDCCWQDAAQNTTTRPSRGVGRIVTEWSAAYDAMPGELLKVVLESLRRHGVAALANRTLSPERKAFLKQFASAQIVSFEQASHAGFHQAGWFYWTLKLEGGAFAEWDFLRGLDEGWFPPIQPPTVDSESVYGTCWEIWQQVSDMTNNNTSRVVHTYPNRDGDDSYWDPEHLAYLFDSQQQNETVYGDFSDDDISIASDIPFVSTHLPAMVVGLLLVAWLGWRRLRRCHHKWQYTRIPDDCRRGKEETMMTKIVV